MSGLINPYALAAVGGSTYSGEVLADSPLGYWRLGEASGTTLVDSSGNSRGGTYTGVTLGTTGLVTGDSDTAATFAGTTTSHADVTYGSWMNVATTVTIEAIVKPNSAAISAGAATIVSRDGSPATQTFILYLASGKPTILYFNNVGGSTGCASSTALTAGTKYHIAATYDHVAWKLYVNGTQVATSSTVNTLQQANTTTGICIGGQIETPTNQNPFNGVIDEVAFYNTALSSTRVSAHAALV